MMPQVSELLYGHPRSTLPVGGTPADDRAYLEWRSAFLEWAADRDLCRRWHESVDNPLNLSGWLMDAHLFQALGGKSPLFGPQDVPIYAHRLRFLGIAFHTRRRAVVKTARKFVEELSRG